jgi:hypothetical protein
MDDSAIALVLYGLSDYVGTLPGAHKSADAGAGCNCLVQEVVFSAVVAVGMA